VELTRSLESWYMQLWMASSTDQGQKSQHRSSKEKYE